MKSNIKRKSDYIINICLILLIFMSMPIVQASVSAQRTIETNVLPIGSGTTVTVVIQNDNTSPLVLLKESIPPGWTLTNISDDAIAFKKTGEWIWSPIGENNSDKNVKYRINVPSSTLPGTYIINGNVTGGNTTIEVTGDLAITVTSDSSGSTGSSDNPTITPTPEKKDINVTGTPTENIAVTTAKKTVAAPIETAKKSPTATNKSPGFGIMISIGVFATIYILRRMK
jgi:hypothetical protein